MQLRQVFILLSLRANEARLCRHGLRRSVEGCDEQPLSALVLVVTGRVLNKLARVLHPLVAAAIPQIHVDSDVGRKVGERCRFQRRTAVSVGADESCMTATLICQIARTVHLRAVREVKHNGAGAAIEAQKHQHSEYGKAENVFHVALRWLRPSVAKVGHQFMQICLALSP